MYTDEAQRKILELVQKGELTESVIEDILSDVYNEGYGDSYHECESELLQQ